jgi:hypothetical protein
MLFANLFFQQKFYTALSLISRKLDPRLSMFGNTHRANAVHLFAHGTRNLVQIELLGYAHNGRLRAPTLGFDGMDKDARLEFNKRAKVVKNGLHTQV